MVQAYSVIGSIFHACGDLGSAAETAGEAMAAWDQNAPALSPARDSQVGAALKGAAATLHATLPLAEEETFKVGHRISHPRAHPNVSTPSARSSQTSCKDLTFRRQFATYCGFTPLNTPDLSSFSMCDRISRVANQRISLPACVPVRGKPGLCSATYLLSAISISVLHAACCAAIFR